MEWMIDKGRPICPQLEEQIAARIALGEFAPGEKLRSVRDVALEAGINPNTVQKAFSGLEAKGLIYPLAGSGWYVGESMDAAALMLEKLAKEKAESYLRDMKLIGKTAEEAARYVLGAQTESEVNNE